MQKLLQEMVLAIELHDVAGIAACFAKGLSPNASHNGQPLLVELTSGYTRGPRFAQCVQCFVNAGLAWPDAAYLAVLLDDEAALGQQLVDDPQLLERRYTQRCAYTQMNAVSLLHICAEYNSVRCAQLLLQQGLHVNIAAGLDEDGYGGQTPLFHTVNQNGHHSADVFELLLQHGAAADHFVKGVVWGRGYAWQTLLPHITPISYATMGCLPQMHRNESTIAAVIERLLTHHYGTPHSVPNVPNRYLHN